MEQLLSIKHIPIKVEVKVQRAELKQVENTAPSAPSVKVSSNKNGGLCLRAEPYRMDLSESRNYDAYVPSGGSDGITLTYEAIAKLADGSSAGSPKLSDEVQQFTSQNPVGRVESVLSPLPKNRNSAVSYYDGTLSINYQMQTSGASDVQMTDDMPEFEFIPGSIEFIIKQMPELDIEYLGDPIYFPRSADPNYEPPLDIRA
ncbi:MAG: hypothetical protein J6C96_02605 [Oscillospiraceae bacterium]|nr:hypothetical protein [Oscillospiraceae bacterium]